MSKERPILFSGEMVSAILNGRKTQTRRVIKPQPVSNPFPLQRCPYGVTGDLLWVRETHYRWAGCGTPPRTGFNQDRCYDDHPELLSMTRHAQIVTVPSIHMPRWASRITLRVVDVRVERVQEISESDAKAEGVAAWHNTTDGTVYRPEFCLLWDSINAAIGFGWEVNPWVWVVEFERAQP